MMLENVTIVRFNDKLRETDARVLELKERWRQASVLDRTPWANAPLSFLNQLENMLELARVIVLRGAGPRREPRVALQARFPQA